MFPVRPMIRFKTEKTGLSLSVVAVLLLFMILPALGLLKVWPLPSALTSGLTLVFVGLFFGIMLLNRRKSGFHFNGAVLFILVLMTALVCSVALNSYAYESTWRWYLITFIACIMTLVAASELKASDPHLFHERISHILWIGCLVYSVVSLLKYYGLLTLVFPWVEPPGGRLVGVWGQPNLTTTTAWLGLLAGAVVLSAKQQKGWWYASILVFGWTLACAASRMSWLMVVGLLALILVSQLSRYRAEETRYASRSLGQGIALVVILLILVPLLNQPLRAALTSFGLLDQSSVVSLVDRNLFQDSARLTEFSKVFSAAGTFSWTQWLF